MVARVAEFFRHPKNVELYNYAPKKQSYELEYPLKGPVSTMFGFSGKFDQPKFKRNLFERVITDVRPKDDRDGYHLIFHDPYTIASDASLNIQTATNRSVQYLIDPKIVSFDESLADYDPQEFVEKSFHTDESVTKVSSPSRFCAFSDEKQLKFFKVYNHINCEHECMSNLTLASCGCVQFFMVRSSLTRICGAIDEKCFRKVENDFERLKISCNCMETCGTLKYNVEIRPSPYV